MGTAKLIKELAGDPAKHQKIGVYELNPELEGNKFVVISSIDLSHFMMDVMKKTGLTFSLELFGTETFIFPSDGMEITNFSELQGSQKHTMSHKQVLNDLDYEVINPMS